MHSAEQEILRFGNLSAERISATAFNAIADQAFIDSKGIASKVKFAKKVSCDDGAYIEAYQHILFGPEIPHFFQPMDVVQLDDNIPYVYLCSLIARKLEDSVVMPVLVSPPKVFFDGSYDELRLLVLEANQLKFSMVTVHLFIKFK
jgi:hypothetical protein